MSSITGGEHIATMLAAEGVEVVFGIIDGTYFGLYSTLGKHGIRLVTPRHESTAAHMAGAYARMSGRLGVCLASNGPGVANVLPGIAVEQGEGNRVLVITSSRRTGIGYPDRGGTFQYFDQTAVTRPMTKWSGTASSFDRIAEMFHRALRTAYSGRPGVVHLDVPEDLMNGKTKAPGAIAPSRYRRTEPIAADDADVERAAELLCAAERPIIHAGSGVIHARAFDELARVAELLVAPITTSWGGRGAMAETSEFAVAMPYVDLNNDVRSSADLVLVVGSRLGETDWWGKAPYWGRPDKQKLIQVDIDEAMLGLNRAVDLAVLADARGFLDRLALRLEASPPPSTERRSEWVRRIDDERRAARATLDKKLEADASPVHPAQVPVVCQDFFDDDDILVIDGGNTAIWSHFFHECRRPWTVLSTFKFGMLGAGLGQALGAQLARPDRRVYCITGDGAMGFHPQEIETAVRNELPVVFIVLCDQQWGMVKMNQQFALKPLKTLVKKTLSSEETINADLGPIHFDLVAQAMGAHGERVTAPEDLRPALERAAASGLPAVVHVDVDPVAHLWAPNLRSFKDMHAEPKG